MSLSLDSSITTAHLDSPTWERDITPLTLRRGLAAFPTGVVAVTGTHDDGTDVMVSSSFAVGISWEPALVSFAAQRSSRTWPRLRAADTIGVSLLSDAQTHLCPQLSSRTADRLAGVPTHVTDRGTVLLAESSLWLETRVHQELDAGDHVIVLLEVLGFADHSEHRPPAALHLNAFHGLNALV
ncbi:MAG: flavin reductase family protein [Micrococcus sp.]|nr:flavin reductase family protein [Micrococcus sp.]